MTIDALRLAAIAYARASDKHAAMVAFGAGVAPARVELDRAARALIQASDAHRERRTDVFLGLLKVGHTAKSAKALIAKQAAALRPSVRELADAALDRIRAARTKRRPRTNKRSKPRSRR